MVVTVAEIASGARSTLLVIHDLGHGGWQLLDGQDLAGRKPLVVPKAQLLKVDPSLAGVTDLPVGWRARRSSRGDDWQREPNPSADPDQHQ
jgi:hypothetical protein